MMLPINGDRTDAGEQDDEAVVGARCLVGPCGRGPIHPSANCRGRARLMRLTSVGVRGLLPGAVDRVDLVYLESELNVGGRPCLT